METINIALLRSAKRENYKIYKHLAPLEQGNRETLVGTGSGLLNDGLLNQFHFALRTGTSLL